MKLSAVSLSATVPTKTLTTVLLYDGQLPEEKEVEGSRSSDARHHIVPVDRPLTL